MKERREELGVQEDLGSFDIKAKAREDAKAKAEQLVQVDFEDGHTQARETESLACLQVVRFDEKVCRFFISWHRPV